MRELVIVIRQAVHKIPSKSVFFLEEADIQIESKREYDDDYTSMPILKSCKSKDDDEKGDKKESLWEKFSKMELSVMLDILDGYDYLHECIIIMTTNYHKCLDEALIRPGRIDMQLEFTSLKSHDIENLIYEFTYFNIKVPSQLSMTSAKLINEILLPYRKDKEKIESILNQKEYILK